MAANNNKVGDVVQVWLPRPLCCPKLRLGVGIGLHYLAIGENPKSVPGLQDKKAWGNVRVRLTPTAKKLYAQLLGRPEFAGKADPLLLALAWVAEQPPHVRNIQV